MSKISFRSDSPRGVLGDLVWIETSARAEPRICEGEVEWVVRNFEVNALGSCATVFKIGRRSKNADWSSGVRSVDETVILATKQTIAEIRRKRLTITLEIYELTMEYRICFIDPKSIKEAFESCRPSF